MGKTEEELSEKIEKGAAMIASAYEDLLDCANKKIIPEKGRAVLLAALSSCAANLLKEWQEWDRPAFPLEFKALVECLEVAAPLFGDLVLRCMEEK